MKDYQQQAADFLTKHGIKVSAKLTNKKLPSWDGYAKDGPRKNNHFVVTLKNENRRVSFDFFDSESNFRAGKTELDVYSILTCCSSGFHCSGDFEDFCAEFGYDNDSRKAEKLHKACLKQSSKLKKLFVGQAAEDLMEIQ